MFTWNDDHVVEKIVQTVEHDGIIVAESDTVLGLFGRLSKISKEKIDAIKKRNIKPYIVMIPSAQYLPDFIDQKLTEQMQQIMKTYWPGPLTIIFQARADMPDWLKSTNSTIALRVPAHEGLQKVLAQVPGLFTTSANISDQPLPASYEQVDPVILNQVQLVCCKSGVMFDAQASTILDFSSGSIQIIRSGAIVVDSN